MNFIFSRSTTGKAIFSLLAANALCFALVRPASAAEESDPRACQWAITPNNSQMIKWSNYLATGNFRKDRSLRIYHKFLGTPFAEKLSSAQGPIRWLDAGGGLGNALKEFLEKSPGSVGINISYDGINPYGPSGYQLINGKLIEELARNEIPPVDVLTDIYGGMTYTRRPDVVLRKYNGWLIKGGRAFIYLSNPQKYREKIDLVLCADGRSRTLVNWLMERSGLKGAQQWVSPYSTDQTVVSFTHQGDLTPPSLKMLSIHAAAPPRRLLVEDFVDPKAFAAAAGAALKSYSEALPARFPWLKEPPQTFGVRENSFMDRADRWLSEHLFRMPPLDAALDTLVASKTPVEDTLAVWSSDDPLQALKELLAQRTPHSGVLFLSRADGGFDFLSHSIVITASGARQTLGDFMTEQFKDTNVRFRSAHYSSGKAKGTFASIETEPKQTRQANWPRLERIFAHMEKPTGLDEQSLVFYYER